MRAGSFPGFDWHGTPETMLKKFNRRDDFEPDPTPRRGNGNGGAPAFLVNHHPPRAQFAADVIDGLSRTQKTIPPKYFYDARGSDLFERICRTEEYYVTRTELGLLDEIGPEIGELVGPHATIVEFGSGSEDKIRRLLGALRDPYAYVAIDISLDALKRSVEVLAADFRDIKVGGVCADFHTPIELPTDALSGEGRRLAFFPGSTIGNMERANALLFLKTIRSLLADDDGFVIGVDLQKERATLESAYNDAEGVTAAFNLNLIDRMNRELGGTLDIRKFKHCAYYNEAFDRIEMHLESLEGQEFEVAGRAFRMERGETIHTENSHKYSIDQFDRLASQAGFRRSETWTDTDDLFSIHYLEPDESD
jgi:L-histidine N-alpha-methyltransferase